MHCASRERALALRAQQKAAAGGAVLPGHFRRLLIKQETGARGVWDFDFMFHNRTRFAGLENGFANCYTNALWHVLYFIPALRSASAAVTLNNR